MGRHSAADDEDTADTSPIDPVTGSPSAAASNARSDVAGVQSGTHADLQMLRDNPALRSRCIAAALVPFILYTVVLVVIGRADIYLVWVWIPIVLAGILVGTLLDLGYRSARRSDSGRHDVAEQQDD